MRTEPGLTPHSSLLTSQAEQPAENMMTFPYLARPERCNGCADCVRECPVNALELLGA